MTGILNASTVFILGAMHALEPGHGKTAIASYTLGNKNAKNHLITLVLSMAFSHTIMLLLIGVIIMFLFPLFDSKKAEYAIGIFSSFALILVGMYILYKVKNGSHTCSEACVHHTPILTRNVPTNSDIGNLKMTRNTAVVHTHKTTALVGILSGIIPCPTAIAAFLMAGQAGKSANSLWYVLIYVLGFTIVMLAIAFIFTIIGGKLNTAKTNFKILKKLDLISAWLIIIVGTGSLLYNSLFHVHS